MKMKSVLVMIGIFLTSINARAAVQLVGFIPNSTLQLVCHRFEAEIQDYQNLASLGDADSFRKMRENAVRRILTTGRLEIATAKIIGISEVVVDPPSFKLEGQSVPKAEVDIMGSGAVFRMKVAGLCPYMGSNDPQTAASLLISEFVK